MKNTILDRRKFVALTTIAAVSACVSTERVDIPTGTRLIILRHADRAGLDLSQNGRARAMALVPALADIEIDAIYSPGTQRNLDTAAPLSAARGLPIQRLHLGNPAARLMEMGRGKTIVWVGNKGNLSAIWESLGAPEPPPLNYGDLYIVEPSSFGPPHVVRMHFGP